MSSSLSTLETLQFRRAAQSDAELLAAFARTVFIETFSARNTPENMTHYLNASLTNEKILEEILDPENTFVLVEHQQVIIAYYKLTVGFERQILLFPHCFRKKLPLCWSDFMWILPGTEVLLPNK